MKRLSRFTIPSLFFIFLFMGVVPQTTANAATGNSQTKQTSTTIKQPAMKDEAVTTIPTVSADQVTAHRRNIQTEKDALQKLQNEMKTQAKTLQIQQKLATLKDNPLATAARREFLQKQIESLNESLNILKTKVRFRP